MAQRPGSVPHADVKTQTYRDYLFPIVAVGALMLFLAAPWPFALKAHVALHGLCAQRPSHSLRLGAETLPFDARMTGIYGGFLGAAIYLCSRRRHRAAGLPTKPALAALGLFVAVMGVDGFNSLFLDLGWWHPYTPDNRLRLVTGLMTGVTLAAAICYLCGLSLWRRPREDVPVVTGVREVGLMLAIQAPFAVAALSGLGWLYVPITLALLLSATAVVSALMLVVVVLLTAADNSFESVRQVQGIAATALLLGIGVIALFAGGRFLLESLTNAPPLT